MTGAASSQSAQSLGVKAPDARLVAVMNVHGVDHLLTLNTADFSRYPGIAAGSSADAYEANNTCSTDIVSASSPLEALSEAARASPQDLGLEFG